jgi:hypothetical protein
MGKFRLKLSPGIRSQNKLMKPLVFRDVEEGSTVSEITTKNPSAH